jgi:ABC-type Na+ efflux pump permease subunit
MIGGSKIRTWKALAALAAVLALLILLLPQAADHHAVAVVFLLIPLFLFAALVECSVPCPPQTGRIFASKLHVRPTLFQRPPPSLA